jgi:hypothetical protein
MEDRTTPQEALARVQLLELLRSPSSWPGQGRFEPGEVLVVYRKDGAQGLITHRDNVAMPVVWMVRPDDTSWRLSDLRKGRRRRSRRGNRRIDRKAYPSLAAIVNDGWSNNRPWQAGGVIQSPGQVYVVGTSSTPLSAQDFERYFHRIQQSDAERRRRLRAGEWWTVGETAQVHWDEEWQ